MSYHLYPINDYQEHTLKATSCGCNPVIKFKNGKKLIVHHSYDGRENQDPNSLASYGKETHIYYEGNDLAKSSSIYHTYLNYTSKDRQPFDIDKVLDVRLVYSQKLKNWEKTGKQELDYSPDFCRREIKGCDLLLKLLVNEKAY